MYKTQVTPIIVGIRPYIFKYRIKQKYLTIYRNNKMVRLSTYLLLLLSLIGTILSYSYLVKKEEALQIPLISLPSQSGIWDMYLDEKCLGKIIVNTEEQNHTFTIKGSSDIGIKVLRQNQELNIIFDAAFNEMLQLGASIITIKNQSAQFTFGTVGIDPITVSLISPNQKQIFNIPGPIEAVKKDSSWYAVKYRLLPSIFNKSTLNLIDRERLRIKLVNDSNFCKKEFPDLTTIIPKIMELSRR